MIVQKSISKNTTRNPWSWIPTLYFAEGLPYVVVMTVSVIMYKRLGISNSDIALYTSWLYLPWVIKPLWSPVVDLLKSKRIWITVMQAVIGAGMAGVALTIPAPDFFQFTLLFFWLIAFSSATHDIAADGFYMLALDEKQQAFFVGIRSTFYRIAMITGQGLLVIFAGFMESTLSLPPANLTVISRPDKIMEKTISVDSNKVKPLAGKLRLIVNPDTLNIGTIPQKKSDIDFFRNFARNMNIMNRFTEEEPLHAEVDSSEEFVGNAALVNFRLSKKPGEGDEYIMDLKYLEGETGISVIEGDKFVFNSKNWDKPAYAVIQIDPAIQKNTSAVFRIQSDKVPFAWVFTFVVIAALFILLFIYHRFILPSPVKDHESRVMKQTDFSRQFFRTFFRFFEKEKILIIILFLLFYRLGESQLVKMASPFMLDDRSVGGLGLSTADVGFIYGTIGIIALVLGGILGGYVVSKKGLKFWLWWMIAAINIPDLVYVYLSFVQPSSLIIINACVAIEQFGYGFGFTAYMLYMIYISEGEFKTAHFAIATGFMALGMMIPGMFSGMIQEAVGYKLFFVWVCIATIPSFLIAKFIPIKSDFGIDQGRRN